MRYVGAILAIAGLLGSIEEVNGQVQDNGCLRLLGSVACPGFSFAYLSPGNLSNAFPIFQDVTDVRSFDAAALNYFSNPFQWETTKFQTQLGCSNSSNAVLRYQRTVLCSNWVNSQWSRACTELYNGTSAATSQKMVCQSTCLDFATSENQIVNNTVADFCPGPDLTNGTRAETLEKDFVDCTNWTTLATNNSETCVSGEENGEGNCGYGSSTVQLCAHCSGDEVDDCCYDSNTDISVCGFALSPRPSSSSDGTSSSTSSSPEGSGTLSPGNQGVGSTGMSGGQLAGTIVGSVLGGLLLLGLLIFLLLCLRKRRRQPNRDSSSSFAADPSHAQGGAGAQTSDRGMFASIFPTKAGAGGANPNSSEKGLLGRNHQGATSASTPTMGGDTLYSGMGRSTDAGFGPGGSASAVGAGAGTGLGIGAAAGTLGGPGMRNSGIVLPRVRDENQSGDRWIETGAEVHVLWPYQAALPDELDLRPGMKLKVLRLYDDAWGTGVIASGGSGSENGKQGAFPIVCVSEGSTLGSTPSHSASEEST